MELNKIFNYINSGDRFYLESIRRDSDCMLTNAFYFKGTWKIKFDPKRTKSMEFHTDPQNAIDVPFMLHNEKYLVNEDDVIGAKWLIMPFDVSITPYFLCLYSHVLFDIFKSDIH